MLIDVDEVIVSLCTSSRRSFNDELLVTGTATDDISSAGFTVVPVRAMASASATPMDDVLLLDVYTHPPQRLNSVTAEIPHVSLELPHPTCRLTHAQLTHGSAVPYGHVQIMIAAYYYTTVLRPFVRDYLGESVPEG